MSSELNRQLAEELNDEMKSSTLPVTTFVGVEIVLGFFGNLIILFVFLFHYHKCNFRYFVLCLSFIDTTSTLTTMPGEMVTQTYWYIYPVPIICKIKSFFNVFTVCGSAFCLLIIAVDRFRKICRPLQWQINHSIALTLCFVQLGVSFIIALPVAFLWGTHSYQEHYKGHNITVTVCEKDEEFKSTDYHLVYTIITETIITCTMIAMVVLYIIVYRSLLSSTSKFELTTPAVNKRNDDVGESTLSDEVTSEEENSHHNVSVIMQGTPNAKTFTETTSSNIGNLESTKTVSTLPLTTSGNASKTLLSPVGNKAGQKEDSKKAKRAKRIRRKTLIMFILTMVFILTTILYLTLLSFIADDVLPSLSDTQKSVYFFFFRLYFINHVINPILYGILDPYFRLYLKQGFKSVISFCSSRLAICRYK